MSYHARQYLFLGVLCLSFFFTLYFAPACLAQDEKGPPQAPEPPKQSAAQIVGPTKENLQLAFQRQYQSSADNLEKARKADAEGFAKAASLFRALAAADEVLAGVFARMLTDAGEKPSPKADPTQLKATLDNVHSAIQQKSQLRDVLYPAFAKKAQEEQNSSAAQAFDYAQKSQAQMVNLLVSPLANPNQWKTPRKKKFIVCTKCGYVTSDLSLVTCPISGDARKNFSEGE